jgi:hypothetical protein
MKKAQNAAALARNQPAQSGRLDLPGDETLRSRATVIASPWEHVSRHLRLKSLGQAADGPAVFSSRVSPKGSLHEHRQPASKCDRLVEDVVKLSRAGLNRGPGFKQGKVGMEDLGAVDGEGKEWGWGTGTARVSPHPYSISEARGCGLGDAPTW